MKEHIVDMFRDWEETLIWSCLQGVMGEVYTNAAEDAAMAIIGAFAFLAGKPDEELVLYKPENYTQGFIIMVPRNDEWAALIELCYGDKAKKVTRYAIKKEPEVFDVVKLQQAVSALPDGYELRMIEETEYTMCQNSDWANDLVSQYKDYETYKS